MFVGVCRLTFQLFGVSSLKEKRSIVRRIVERTRVKFNASVAEISDNDSHQRSVVGAAVVGNERAHVDAMISSVIRFVEHIGTAPLVGVETEVIPMKGEIGDHDFRSMDGFRDGEIGVNGETDADFDVQAESEEDEWQ